MNGKRLGIRANGDIALTFGSFDSIEKAIWYGDSEFGKGKYSLVIL